MKTKKSFKLLVFLAVIVIMLTSQSFAQAYQSMAAEPKILSISDMTINVYKGDKYSLPKSVTATMDDKTTKEVAITWGSAKPSTAKIGKFTYKGTVKGYSKKINLYLVVKAVPTISSVQNVELKLVQGQDFALPKTVTATMSDKTTKQVDVKWNTAMKDTNTAGSFDIKGTISGYSKGVTLKLNIVKLTVQDIAKESRKVVLINVYDEDDELDTTGSGFIISSDGKVVTNYHVIEYASRLEIVTNDKKVYPVTGIVNYSKERDIAILKVQSAAPFEFVALGNSAKLALGQEIVAIGSPLGLQNTVSTGIISSIRDNMYRTVQNSRDIQISAPVSPGSSGGALFNMQGEVVGITYAGETDGQNINYAIPIEELETIKEDKNYTIDAVYEREHMMEYLGGQYEGGILDGVPHGYGVLAWSDDVVYMGQWQKGRITGRGIRTYENGDEYIGDFTDGLREGVGRMFYADGREYIGDWKADKRHGEGAFLEVNGDEYEGQWQDDKEHGFGVVYLNSGQLKGTIYSGEWVEGKVTGKGKYYLPNGAIIEGTWVDGTFVY